MEDSAWRQLNQTVQDILLTLTDQLLLLKLSATGAKFIYLAVNSRDTNLAQARQMMKMHSSSPNQALVFSSYPVA